MTLRKIISGGQTGVDRGALLAAIDHGVNHGGWCPQGRRAEDGAIDQKFELRESPTREYAERTELNVMDSDGTLILFRHEISGGTKLTRRLARKYRRPLLEIELSTETNENLKAILSWIESHQIHTLNIAGPRESGEPGIQKVTQKIVAALLKACDCSLPTQPSPP